MRRSTDRIITTHAGSLSRPSDLIALNRARAAEETWDDGAYQKCLSSAVADVIRKQQELGVDIPDDGEFGKPMAANYDYGVMVELRLCTHGRICAGRFGCGIRTQEIERGRRCADDDQEPARLAEIQRILPGPGIKRHACR